MRSFWKIMFPVLATVVLLLNTLPTAAIPPMTSELEWKGRIVVEFSEALGEIDADLKSGLVQLGDDELDAIARQYNVHGIEQFFPGEEKPLDPAIRDLSRYYILEFPVEIDLHEVVQAYAAAPFIVSAEPYYIRTLDYTPSDPYFVSQWHLPQVGAELAYDYSQGSENIVVGIVDSGTDTSHTDLRDNLWVNPGEDLNGNGIIDPLEWNAVDDDGNGYTDDFWGWNVWQWNNNVYDSDTHGSHCAGCATAVTDNANGVASLGFKSKIMTARAGDGYFIYASSQGITYCANNGADVISLSYGSGQFWSPENSAIQAAWNQGVLIFAAAGNENTSAPHYPSAYTNVIAVAATNQSDNKAYFSNYGTWIDVCAPGMAILSTVPPSSYISYQGTSMSSPVAAGLGALIRGTKPEWTNAQVANHLFATCFNIDPINPGYAGLLGYGRIDAGNAISSLFPNLSYTEQAFDDVAGGNGNGRPEPGESVNLLLTVANTSASVNASGVEISVTCDDPGIVLTSSVSTLGNIPAGGSANNYADLISFDVDPAFDPHLVTFELTLTETGMGITFVEDLTQMIGFPDVMLVDDDGGDAYESWYQQDLETIGYAFESWDVNAQGEIPLATLQGYPAVVWFTSGQDNPLSSGEQTVIETYLNGGGNLFLTGEDIDEQMAGTAFYSNVLHSSSLGSPGFFQLYGVDGDPISGGTELILVGAGGAGNSVSPAEIEPVGDAETIYTYSTTTNPGGIRWNDAYSHLVYFAFNFEAASGINTTPRDSLLLNIFNWFDLSSPPPPPPEMIVEVTYVSGSPVPAGGGNLYYAIWAENQSGSTLDWDGWVDMVYEGGAQVFTVINREILNFQPGWTVNRPDVMYPVPSDWPGGNYQCVAHSGEYPDVVWYQDSFPWVKEGAVDLDFDFEAHLPTAGVEDPFDLTDVVQTGVTIPSEFAVLDAYPNPFNPATTISFALPSEGKVTLSVYDVNGRLVSTLVEGYRNAGVHEVTFDGSNLASGIYLYRLEAGQLTASGKMVLMK